MACNINDSHWNVLLDFMEKPPQFAKGQFVGPTGKTVQRKLWVRLAGQLNVGYGQKSVEKWQKAWADIKYGIKKKSVVLKRDLTQTGGGPPFGKKFRKSEERVLAILGKTFAEGVGSEECGLLQDVNIPSTSYIPSTSHCSFEAIASIPDPDLTVQGRITEETPDHNYTPSIPKTFKKRKLSQGEQEMDLYRETLAELRGIIGESSNTNRVLADLGETMKLILGAIVQK